MPKGEYDTPGPFYVDDDRIIRRKPLALAQGTLWITLDQAEREELVGLLNKGTHFNRLLEAAKDAISRGLPPLYHVNRLTLSEASIEDLRAAIAECEPTE